MLLLYFLMDSTLTLISLADTRLHAPLISHELFLLLEQASSRKEKVALLYNRRGLGRAWICQDCGYYPPCPHCDIALAYHTTPHRTLLCHQCSHTMPIIVECPSCRGSRFDAVGIGIQKIESDLKRLFPLAHIERIDSDRDEKKSELAALMNHTDILITTYTAV